MTLNLGFGVTQVIESGTIRSVDPENPTLEANMTTISTRLRSCGHFVCPRWPSAAILDFVEPQIAPFDPPTPKTLA